MNPRARPLMLYDGNCRFCGLWIARWRAATGDAVEFRTSQAAAPEFPEIPADDFARSVQLIEPDGSRHEGADAVTRMMARAGPIGRLARRVYESVPPARAAMEAGYRWVARDRPFFSAMTRLLWGRDVLRPTYAISTLVFLRLLALTYLIAFVSFALQADGLIGSRGILPVRDLLPRIREALGAEAWWQFPTLCWLASSDAAIAAMAWTGAALAVAAIGGVALPVVLAALWALYLSLTVAGQVFYSFQWDVLLLEAGFLAIFLAPFRLRPNLGAVDPPRFSRFAVVWLLCRFMFASGVIKLTSGDPYWRDFTALEYHYLTQPLPTPVAWYAHQLPPWFQRASCAAMFAIELGLPVFAFLPRRPRLVACAAFLALQGLIALTGNYGFFNLLVAALCLLLVDDFSWKRAGLRLRAMSPGRPVFPRWVSIPVVGFVFVLSWVPFLGCFRTPMPWLEPVAALYEKLAPFRTVNGYGLFAVMTTRRREILVQGSDDGFNWKTYQFKFKPGDLSRAPAWVAPYMPRLDWQMWFAALGDARSSPWLVATAARLLDAEPSVLGLLERDPFDGRPPRYVRALLDDYRFTTFAERKSSGRWWRSEPVAIFLPELSADDLR